MHLPPPLQDEEEYLQIGHAHIPVGANIIDNMVSLDIQHSPDFEAYHNQAENDHAISLDSRRLQLQHTTEGYRDGIISGKAESIQQGFDEGFGLGAHVGLKAGRLLGLLEGIAAALRENPSHEAMAYADQLLSRATSELSVDSIFAEEYWASDGSWTYPVQGSGSDGDVVYEDVASEHPLISKWSALVDQELKSWNLDQNLAIFSGDTVQSEADGASAPTQDISRQAVDW
ncbi:uncharacterized protein GGS25DRAFT_403784 [Hypoxylon fragiforme]|uniref:uncharacterized protein n=1 Tax=Hypoxylon fragiforme TaxID=63214 RepID=UPI0020C73710|nr:uncharacterized protein GGS25DRAFT_403784 [Hypoxylon fragiforme]KAI2604914.1 hypothetical protein GGS25DRAFT_403784 [Hypoxylon fragiforme]